MSTFVEPVIAVLSTTSGATQSHGISHRGSDDSFARELARAQHERKGGSRPTTAAGGEREATAASDPSRPRATAAVSDHPDASDAPSAHPPQPEAIISAGADGGAEAEEGSDGEPSATAAESSVGVVRSAADWVIATGPPVGAAVHPAPIASSADQTNSDPTQAQIAKAEVATRPSAPKGPAAAPSPVTRETGPDATAPIVGRTAAVSMHPAAYRIGGQDPVAQPSHSAAPTDSAPDAKTTGSSPSEVTGRPAARAETASSQTFPSQRTQTTRASQAEPEHRTDSSPRALGAPVTSSQQPVRGSTNPSVAAVTGVVLPGRNTVSEGGFQNHGHAMNPSTLSDHPAPVAVNVSTDRPDPTLQKDHTSAVLSGADAPAARVGEPRELPRESSDTPPAHGVGRRAATGGAAPKRSSVNPQKGPVPSSPAESQETSPGSVRPNLVPVRGERAETASGAQGPDLSQAGGGREGTLGHMSESGLGGNEQAPSGQAPASRDTPGSRPSASVHGPDPGRFQALSRDAIQQMVRSVEAEIHEDVSNLRMHLAPGKLGNLDLRLAVDHGVLTARFVAQSEQVRALIESALPDLKQQLEQQGVQVNQLNVSVGEQGQNERHAPWERSAAPTSRKAAAVHGAATQASSIQAQVRSTGVDVLV